MLDAKLRVTSKEKKLLYESHIYLFEGSYIEEYCKFGAEIQKRPASLDEDKLNIVKIANRDHDNKFAFENWNELKTGDYFMTLTIKNIIPESSNKKEFIRIYNAEFNNYKCISWICQSNPEN